jgi:hypothetical protein
MALSTFVGNFTQPTSTNASFAVTGTGFTPKVIILFATNETGIGVSTNWTQYMGMATSTSNRCAISSVQLTTTNSNNRAHDNTKCFIVESQPSGTTIVAADLVSFDSNGFTLNFSTVDLIARVIGYIAIGGSDLTNAFIKEFIGAASNTAQGFTGVGFKGDAMFLLSAGVSGAPPANDGGAGCNPVIGFATATAQEVSYAEAFNATESGQFAKIIAKSSSAGSLTMAATLTSFDSDGFTVTYSASSSQKRCFALCLKGGQYAVGTFNQATGTGNQGITGPGFQPSGVILQSINAASNASVITTQSRLSFGAASSSSARVSMWAGGGNGGIADNDIDTGKILNMITEGASPTTNTSADFVSMDSGGFTVNNTTTDATSREIAYFAMGSNAVTGGNKLFTRNLLGVGL